MKWTNHNYFTKLISILLIGAFFVSNVAYGLPEYGRTNDGASSNSKLSAGSRFAPIATVLPGIASEIKINLNDYKEADLSADEAWKEFWIEFVLPDDVYGKLTEKSDLSETAQALINDSFMAVFAKSNDFGDLSNFFTGRITLEAFIDGEELVIAVTDNGMVREGRPLKRSNEDIAIGTVKWYPQDEGTRTEVRVSLNSVAEFNFEDNERIVVVNLDIENQLRDKSAFVYMAKVFADCLKIESGISHLALIPEMRRIVDTEERVIAQRGDAILAGFDVEGLRFNGTDEYTLPMKYESGRKFRYIFYIDERNNVSPDVTISLGDGTKVYVRVEEVEEAKKDIVSIVAVEQDASDRPSVLDVLNSEEKIATLDELMAMKDKVRLTDDDMLLMENLLEFFLWKRRGEKREDLTSAIKTARARGEDIIGQLIFLVETFSIARYNASLTEEEEQRYSGAMKNASEGTFKHNLEHIVEPYHFLLLYKDSGHSGISSLIAEEQEQGLTGKLEFIGSLTEMFDFKGDPKLALMVVDEIIEVVNSTYTYNKKIYELMKDEREVQTVRGGVKRSIVEGFGSRLEENEWNLRLLHRWKEESVGSADRLAECYDFVRNIKQRIAGKKGSVEIELKESSAPGANWYDKSLLSVKNMEYLAENLLNNSIDAKSEGASLTIKVVLSTETDASGKYIVISYSDDGPGMTEEVLNKIMNREYYSSKEKTNMSGGKGMPIIFKRVEEIGGTLEIESPVSEDPIAGKGTTFIMKFPVVTEDILAGDAVQAAENIVQEIPAQIKKNFVKRNLVDANSSMPVIGTFMGEEIEFTVEGLGRCDALMRQVGETFEVKKEFAQFALETLHSMLKNAKKVGIEIDLMTNQNLFYENVFDRIIEVNDSIEDGIEIFSNIEDNTDVRKEILNLFSENLDLARGGMFEKFWSKVASTIPHEMLLREDVQAKLRTLVELDVRYDILKTMLKNFSSEGNASIFGQELFDINGEFSRELTEVRKFLADESKRRSNVKDFSHVKFDVEENKVLLINTDKTLLTVILNELVTNALESLSSEEGMVEGNVSLRAKKKGNILEIIISDSGQGISSDEIRHMDFIGYSTKKDIFESTYGPGAEGGRGLGTCVMMQAVKMLKGVVKVASEVGEGTTVTVNFPLYDDVSISADELEVKDEQALPVTPIQDNFDAKIFHDNIIRTQLDEERPLDFIAINTSFIKGYSDKTKKGDGQRAAMIELISEMQRFLTKGTDKKIEWIIGDSKLVTDAVMAKKSNARGLVLGSIETVDMIEMFLRRVGRENDENVVLAGVDDKDMAEMGYVPIMEMLRVMLDVFRVRDLTDSEIARMKNDHPLLGISSLSKWRIMFAPKAEAMEYGELKKLYAADCYA